MMGWVSPDVVVTLMLKRLCMRVKLKFRVKLFDSNMMYDLHYVNLDGWFVVCNYTT